VNLSCARSGECIWIEKKETKGFDWYQQSQRGAGMHQPYKEGGYYMVKEGNGELVNHAQDLL
jgi:hypothetical protein